MQTLRLRLRTGCSPASFSALSIADIDETTTTTTTTTASDYITWVGRCRNPIPLLHESLKRCATTPGGLAGGKACHAQIITFGLKSDTLTTNMLINVYSKLGSLAAARKVFDGMTERSLISWNTMIGSLARNGEEREALKLFARMRKQGSSLSEFTVSSVLCACAAKTWVTECAQLHSFAIKASMDSNIFVGTALLDVYAKSGLSREAGAVFESMPERNLVTWSSMMAGHVRNGLYCEALSLFRRARAVGIELDAFLISSALAACSGLASATGCGQVHAESHKSGFGSSVFVTSSLVDAYAKCGRVAEAHTVFSLHRSNWNSLVLWNAMISGLSRNARPLEAMVLFEKMQQSGLSPDGVTYVSVLSACGRMGLVEDGRKYFNLMRTSHRLAPGPKHYSVMVDILARAGLLDEANLLIKTMPFEPTVPIWGSLLASCRVHGNIQLAEKAAAQLFEMEPENAGNHVLLSNVYAANENWDEVARTRKFLKESGAKKERGQSWVEVKDRVHFFTVGERSHPRTAEIYAKLEGLIEDLKKLGYVERVEDELHDVRESEKNELLRHHSEKLALAFGLLCLPCNAPIQIIKNLRICGDCHTFMKLASGLTGREIIVRDMNRFHHFKNGFCSCREFW